MQRLSATEFRRWQLLEHIEPFGERGDYLRTAMVISALANIHRREGQDPFSPMDFMPRFEPEPEQTPEQMAHRMGLVMTQANAIEERKKKQVNGRR